MRIILIFFSLLLLFSCDDDDINKNTSHISEQLIGSWDVVEYTRPRDFIEDTELQYEVSTYEEGSYTYTFAANARVFIYYRDDDYTSTNELIYSTNLKTITIKYTENDKNVWEIEFLDDSYMKLHCHDWVMIADDIEQKVWYDSYMILKRRK